MLADWFVCIQFCWQWMNAATISSPCAIEIRFWGDTLDIKILEADFDFTQVLDQISVGSNLGIVAGEFWCHVNGCWYDGIDDQLQYWIRAVP